MGFNYFTEKDQKEDGINFKVYIFAKQKEN